MALEESRSSERRLDDNRRNLEIQLENANSDIQVGDRALVRLSLDET